MKKVFRFFAILTTVVFQITAQSQNREVNLAEFFTDTVITDATNDDTVAPKCADNVLRSREAVKLRGNDSRPGWSLGVSPTVELGTALLIFAGVGVFAVVVAFLFQMVSQLLEPSVLTIRLKLELNPVLKLNLKSNFTIRWNSLGILIVCLKTSSTNKIASILV